MKGWGLTIVLILGALFYGLSQEVDEAKRGELSGQWRTFYMSTFNKDSLKDFYALATGIKLKYTYDLPKGVQLDAAIYSSFNTNIQDLTIPDPTTGRFSRYESGLFDVQNLDDRLVLFPGELFVRYKNGSHDVTLGRMKIVSPLVNPQDGRMIPTLEQGVWYTYKPSTFTLRLGWFNAIAPRSTGGFFGIGETIGKYPVGRQANGNQSLYAGNTRSDYMAIASLDFKAFKKLEVKVWNYYVDNVFNTLYVKPSIPLDERGSRLSVEAMLQSRVNNGGNAIDSLAYFSAPSSALLGFQIERKLGAGKVTVGYDRIFSNGRFLFPREWGREFLFSFQKRERSEGAANNHAVVIRYDRTSSIKKSKLRTMASVGHHWKPAVSNAEDNKYAQPNYIHVNLEMRYEHEQWKNLKPALLLTYKGATGYVPPNPLLFLNKVDMFQINLGFNYNF